MTDMPAHAAHVLNLKETPMCSLRVVVVDCLVLLMELDRWNGPVVPACYKGKYNSSVTQRALRSSVECVVWGVWVCVERSVDSGHIWSLETACVCVLCRMQLRLAMNHTFLITINMHSDTHTVK